MVRRGVPGWWLPFLLLALSPAFAQPEYAEKPRYSARTNYMLYCQGCHGADGVGLAARLIPPLAGAMGYFLHVDGGREYLVQVPGAAHAPISDGELAEVINYALRRFNAGKLPDGFTPYTQEEVARSRGSQADVASIRQQLVAAIERRMGVRMWTKKEPRVDLASVGAP